jgi:hypothetical protein
MWANGPVHSYNAGGLSEGRGATDRILQKQNTVTHTKQHSQNTVTHTKQHSHRQRVRLQNQKNTVTHTKQHSHRQRVRLQNHKLNSPTTLR